MPQTSLEIKQLGTSLTVDIMDGQGERSTKLKIERNHLDHVQTSHTLSCHQPSTNQLEHTRVASCPLQRQVLLSQRPPSRDSRQQRLPNSLPTHLPQASNLSFHPRRRPRAKPGHRLRPAFLPPRPAKIGLWSIFCSCLMIMNRWYVAF